MVREDMTVRTVSFFLFGIRYSALRVLSGNGDAFSRKNDSGRYPNEDRQK